MPHQGANAAIYRYRIPLNTREYIVCLGLSLCVGNFACVSTAVSTEGVFRGNVSSARITFPTFLAVVSCVLLEIVAHRIIDRKRRTQRSAVSDSTQTLALSFKSPPLSNNEGVFDSLRYQKIWNPDMKGEEPHDQGMALFGKLRVFSDRGDET